MVDFFAQESAVGGLIPHTQGFWSLRLDILMCLKPTGNETVFCLLTPKAIGETSTVGTVAWSTGSPGLLPSPVPVPACPCYSLAQEHHSTGSFTTQPILPPFSPLPQLLCMPIGVAAWSGEALGYSSAYIKSPQWLLPSPKDPSKLVAVVHLHPLAN